jgi:hypothetical protein
LYKINSNFRHYNYNFCYIILKPFNFLSIIVNEKYFYCWKIVSFLKSGHNRCCCCTSCKVHCCSSLTSCICAKLAIIAIALSAVLFLHLLSDNFHWFFIGMDFETLNFECFKKRQRCRSYKKSKSSFICLK